MHAGVKELAESFKKHKEELDKEVEEELSANRVGLNSSGHGKSAYGLPNNLSSLSHNEQVHHLTDHFMHGGSVDDLEKSGYLSKKQADEVKATNKKVEQEVEEAWKQKEEQLKAEGKSQREIEEERKRFKAKETEDKLRKEAELAKQRGEDHVAATYAAQANKVAMKAKNDSTYNASESTRMLGSNLKVEEKGLANDFSETTKIKAAKDSGEVLTQRQENAIAYKEGLQAINMKDKLGIYRENKEDLVARSYKKDSTDLEKAAALDAIKNGVVTQGDINLAKNDKNKAQSDVTISDVAVEDVFGSQPAPINKSFLAAKREEGAKAAPSQTKNNSIA